MSRQIWYDEATMQRDGKMSVRRRSLSVHELIPVLRANILTARYCDYTDSVNEGRWEQ